MDACEIILCSHPPKGQLAAGLQHEFQSVLGGVYSFCRLFYTPYSEGEQIFSETML